MSLLLDIARCPNVRTCLKDQSVDHPCSVIVTDQKQSLDAFQLPEPWSGNLEAAPILFLGSNPSISYVEEYPLSTWPNEEVSDFFEHRFGGGRKPWVCNGLHTLLRDGTHARAWVRYWASARQRARELLDRVDVQPGVDYAFSEVVHCKSRRELGVRNALDECGGRYLRRIVEKSGARVIVSLGDKPAHVVRREWQISANRTMVGPKHLGDFDRHFVFLPHTNARKDRTCLKCLTADELHQVRETLR